MAPPPADPPPPSLLGPAGAAEAAGEDPWEEYRLPSLTKLVLAFSGLDEADGTEPGDDAQEPWGGVELESLRLDLPVELHVEVGSDGRPRVGVAPPTQTTETSIMPVFHRMKIAIERDDRG